MHKFEFHENLLYWIVCAKYMGLFSYKFIRHNFLRSKLYWLYFLVGLTVFIGNEIYFCIFKNDYSYFGLMFLTIELSFLILWLILNFLNNELLISIFDSFNNFDKSLEKLNGECIEQKKFHKNFAVIFISVMYFLDFVNMFVCVLLLGRSTGISLIAAMSRAIERSFIILFINLYLYIIYSLKIRYEKLKKVWILHVDKKIDNASLQSQLSLKIATVKSLYYDLFNISTLINKCFGSRLVVLFTQLFYYVLLYFYMTCMGMQMIILLLPFYIASIFIVTLTTQHLINTANIAHLILKLRTNKVSERLLSQIHEFIQLLRFSILTITASNFFDVNQQLLCSMTIAIASYLVAIFQLTPVIVRIGSKTTVSFI